jgi:SAM-dependent methyltransferase
MFNFFRRSTLDPLSVTMVGVKLADRVLVVGCRDPRLIAALAIKAGLTGRTCAVDASREVVTHAEVVALKEGALVEFAAATAPFPYDNDAFDVVVLRDVMLNVDLNERATTAVESARVLRPGGRCTVIDGVGGSGVAAIFGRGGAVDPATVHEMDAALKAAGFVAVRTLAERDGLLFLEAVKKT